MHNHISQPYLLSCVIYIETMSNLLKTYAMKTLVKFCFVASLLSVSPFVSAITYTTMNPGNWNDVINVWSTDGGVTPCGCNPGATTSGDDIVINNAITMNFAVTINGGSNMLVLASGKINGGQDLTISSGTVDLFGPATFGFMIVTNGTISLYTGVVMNSGNLQIQPGGVMNLDGAQVICGQTRIFAGGTLNLMNAARYRCITSNFRSNGTINIGVDCCIATNGNFSNNAGGVINGNGVIDSGGNLSNSGIWSINVDWCAFGTGLGLPIPEDCGAVGTVCGAIVLPVELVNFNGELIDENIAEISWETASEHNNDFFLLLKSEDGLNWTEVEKILGAGNSTEQLYYHSIDYQLTIGITYYKLLQYDFDGRVNESDVISVNNNSKELIVYPNPIRIGTALNVAIGDNDAEQLVVLNQNGSVMSIQEINGKTSISLNTNQFTPGVYFVKTIGNSGVMMEKLIVTD